MSDACCSYINDNDTTLLHEIDYDDIHELCNKAIDNEADILNDEYTRVLKQSMYKQMHKDLEIIQINQTLHPVRLLTPPHLTAYGMYLLTTLLVLFNLFCHADADI